MAGAIDRRFGTWRGAVRLGLSYAEVAGGLAATRSPSPGSIRRLVFVCHGNICRSAFADAVARRLGHSTVSFGLSTTSGLPAHPPVIASARQRGIDLSGHVTTAVEDYQPQPGDYLLGMEVRHMRKLAADARLGDVPRGLLGSYAPFPLPHLHDPFGLGEAYLEVCLDRIEHAVERLCLKLGGAATS